MVCNHGLVKPAALVLLGVTALLASPESLLSQQIFRGPEPPHAIPSGPADPSSRAKLGANSGSPVSTNSIVSSSWEGMSQTSSIRPPDPHGAAGPIGILQTVNLRVTYYNKSGAITWGPVSLTGSLGFWGSVGNSASNTNSDPRTLYDPGSGRFFVVMLEASSTQSFLNLAVSKSSNPSTSGTSDWYFYRLDDTETPGGIKYGTDYPGLGYDGQAVYVTYNMYSLPFSSGSTFHNCEIIVLNKSDIIAGTGTYFTVFTPVGINSGFTLQPAAVLGGTTPGNKAYFGEVSFANTTSVRVWALSDPLGTRTLSSAVVTVPNHGGYIDNAPQSDTTITVPTLSPRTQGNAFWYGGALWFCHTAGGGSGKSSVYYYRVNTNDYPTSAPTLAESGFIDGGTGVWTYQPSIGGNAQGDVCLVYTQSSSSMFPTMMSTMRTAGESAFETPITVKASPSFSNSDRWGDFASVTADPTDNTFWITHEWARSSTQHDWGTWWANITAIVLPVQLAGFSGSVGYDNRARLTWTTVSEINNYGFEVQRSSGDSTSYQTLDGGFVPGHGTTLVPQTYSYTDDSPLAGSTMYRLKQIDLDGTHHYSGGIEVSNLTGVAENHTPAEFSLEQNYPNPFNPSTTITYGLPVGTDVTLDVFNTLGQRVALLVSEKEGAGYHRVQFENSGLSSGLYVYRLRAGEFTASKRFLLLK